MNDQQNNRANPSAETVVVTPQPRKRSRKGWIVAGIIGLAGLAGFGAVQAISQPFGGGFGHGHRFGMHGGGFDPARMAERVDYGLDIVLGRVGANEEQKKKIAALVKANLKEVPALREQHHAARAKLVELMKAETFDAAELERLRSQQLATADQMSRKITQAVGEAANILTPKQRQDLVSLWEKRPHRRW